MRGYSQINLESFTLRFVKKITVRNDGSSKHFHVALYVAFLWR